MKSPALCVRKSAGTQDELTNTSHMKETKQHSSAYTAILKAGSHLALLKAAHAHIITTGAAPKSQSLLTKLITLTIASHSITYTNLIFTSITNPDTFLYSSILTATSKHNFHTETLRYYRQMLKAGFSCSSYNLTSVIKACGGLCNLKVGKAVHCQVLVTGFRSDRFVRDALVSFYAKCGALRDAGKVFDEMGDRSVVGWNVMISGYEQNGFAGDAIRVFKGMLGENVEPDKTTCVSLLSACAQLGDFVLGCWVCGYVASKGIRVDVVLGSAMVNMYARCGNMGKAREVFDEMSERNVHTWTSMISGYGMHGFGRDGVGLFYRMKECGLRPNSVTFVAVLSACAHSGLVDEGRKVYESMSCEYGLVPGVEHHVCMVDMLGRAGYLSEAYKFVKEGISNEPAPAVWTAMLGACKMHKNYELGVEVAERLLAIEPENPGHYVLLSNIYALAGRMDRVETIRNMMMKRKLKKQVGYSKIEVGQRTYLFSMGDKSHPETAEIYNYLDELMQRCREVGYAPASESVMHELEEEEREYALKYHSEKIAIAFGLLKSSPGAPIKIVKNLRICEDCHSAVKCISVVTNREIIVRDKLRFHHFKNGVCSCKDYW